MSERVSRHVAARPGLRVVVLNGSAATSIDADGALTLRELYEQLRDAGLRLHFTTLRGPVRDILGRAGLWEELVADGTVHTSLAEVLAAELPEDSPLRLRADEQAPARVF